MCTAQRTFLTGAAAQPYTPNYLEASRTRYHLTCGWGGVPPLSNKMGPLLKKIVKKFCRFGARGASDLDGGPPGNHLTLLFMFWDALELKF